MRKTLTIIILSLTFFTPFSLSAEGKVFLKDYMDRNPAYAVDAMPAVRMALEECARIGAEELILPSGTINIKPDRAYEEYEFISNNDPSLKRIAFLLKDMRNFRIRGENTELLFTGYVSPFSIQNCENISIEGISIDYTRPFVSESRITGAGTGWIELGFPEEYKIRMREGQLTFEDETGNTYPYSNLLEFDPALAEVAFHVHDYWMWTESLPAVKTAEGTYRFYRSDFGEARIGNNMVFGASARLNPAFTLWECNGFTLKNVNIYCCCGMGVIAQCSRDVELNNVKVVPAPGSGRTISISADATHFVNCKGFIKMIDCEFKGQKDDASNIHGWYMSIEERTGPSSVLLKWRNSGQYGIRFIKKGMTLELADSETLEQYARMVVDDVTYLNSEYAEVSFITPLPAQTGVGDVAAEDDGYPSVLISGCYIGNNRARGLLVGSRGNVVIENCTFHTPGSAILFEGDGRYWYEQSGVRDVTIRNNIFLNCMYGSKTWGSAVISVGSGIPGREKSRYHKNIKVENNVFRGFDNRLVNLYCVDGFSFRGNKIEMTDDYPVTGTPEDRFIFNNCDNIVME